MRVCRYTEYATFILWKDRFQTLYYLYCVVSVGLYVSNLVSSVGLAIKVDLLS
jgi:hypothetical protein